MAEVEADAVAVDHLALLADVRAQHMAQGGVQQVGGRVVGADGIAPGHVDLQVHRIAHFHRSAGDRAVVRVQATKRL